MIMAAPIEVWEEMIGQPCTMANVLQMHNQRPDIPNVRVYPWDYPSSPIPPGGAKLVVYYKHDENNQDTICWPAPQIMYGNNALAPAPAPTIG